MHQIDEDNIFWTKWCLVAPEFILIIKKKEYIFTDIVNHQPKYLLGAMLFSSTKLHMNDLTTLAPGYSGLKMVKIRY